MHLILSHLLQPEPMRRMAKITAEPADGVEVGSLRRRRQIADRHVLDHAATERARLGHRGISCLRVGLRQPQSSRQQTSMAIPAYLPRQRVSSIASKSLTFNLLSSIY